MMCSKLTNSWLLDFLFLPVSYRLALQYYHHPDHKHKVLFQLPTIPERSQESQRTKAFCLSPYKISERNNSNTTHHIMSTPPSRSIITYPWTKKTMLFIFMMNLGKVRYIFVFITLPGRAVSCLERVAGRHDIYYLLQKNTLCAWMWFFYYII